MLTVKQSRCLLEGHTAAYHNGGQSCTVKS